MADNRLNILVAFNIGSSLVTALVAQKRPDGAVEILANAEAPSTTFIQRGAVFNKGKMTACLKSLRDKLEGKLNDKQVARAYVGIGGMGMHTVPSTIRRETGDGGTVSAALIEETLDDNQCQAPTGKQILHVEPQEYSVDRQEHTDPEGVIGMQLEGHFKNIVARCDAIDVLNDCFAEADIDIAGLRIAPMALANAMLTDAEKNTGCVFVDMNTDTTTVLVYKKNILRHLAALPLGGNNITKDISSLQIEQDEAEQLKEKYGVAFHTEETMEVADIVTSDGRTISGKVVAELVEARVEEILQNVENQIELSRLQHGQLIGGLVATGATAQMPNMEPALAHYTHLTKVRLENKIKANVVTKNTGVKDFNKDGQYNAAIALLMPGGENCCKKKEEASVGLRFDTPTNTEQIAADTTNPTNTQTSTAGRGGGAATARNANSGKPIGGSNTLTTSKEPDNGNNDGGNTDGGNTGNDTNNERSVGRKRGFFQKLRNGLINLVTEEQK